MKTQSIHIFHKQVIQFCIYISLSISTNHIFFIFQLHEYCTVINIGRNHSELIFSYADANQNARRITFRISATDCGTENLSNNQDESMVNVVVFQTDPFIQVRNKEILLNFYD